MKKQWSPEQANEWYQNLGWLRGCNFIGSDCANRLDMFQKYHADEKLQTAERELALCQKIGFNTVRIWANFDVYYMEPDSYMEIFEKYITLCAKYGQKVMVVLTHEEDLPRGDVFSPKPMGEQSYVLGSHQGRRPLTPEEEKLEQHHYMEYPELRERFMEMITRTVARYANDERIFCWNVYNEPGIQLGDRAIPLLRTLFSAIRELDPVQPLCADVWSGIGDDALPITPAESEALALSDVVSYHSYRDLKRFSREIFLLKKIGRPVFLTEWLHRIRFNTVQETYPILFMEQLSCYCWGFVVGKTQTNEPWDSMWTDYETGRRPDYDFTKWQHDLFRPNLRPYDPHEIDLIEHFNKLSDQLTK